MTANKVVREILTQPLDRDDWDGYYTTRICHNKNEIKGLNDLPSQSPLESAMPERPDQDLGFPTHSFVLRLSEMAAMLSASQTLW